MQEEIKARKPIDLIGLLCYNTIINKKYKMNENVQQKGIKNENVC